jgi:hypothetical protein
MNFGARASADNFGELANAFRWMMRVVLQVAAYGLYVDDSYAMGIVLRQPDGSWGEVGVRREHRFSWAWFCWSKLAARWGFTEELKKQIFGSAVIDLGIVIDWWRDTRVLHQCGAWCGPVIGHGQPRDEGLPSFLVSQTER